MIRALLLAAAVGLAAPQAPQQSQAAATHVIAVYADLDSAAALRAFVVLRAFVEQHPGAALVEVHVNPPNGRVRPVDRAAVAARGMNAGLAMAEMIAVNLGRRSDDDFAAMARQLRLDRDQFRTALAADVDAAIAEDVAAAASLKLAKDVGLVIDGEPLRVALTLSELEARLLPR